MIDILFIGLYLYIFFLCWYFQSFPEAHGYQNKVIENWDDIILLCGCDRAIGDGAEIFQDAAEIMDQEGNEAQSNINLEE